MTLTDTASLTKTIVSAVAASPDAQAAMTAAVRLLKDNLPYYSWAGIYVLDGPGKIGVDGDFLR